jgi:hypothetical protein
MERYPIINNGYQFVFGSMAFAVLIAVAGAWITAKADRKKITRR